MDKQDSLSVRDLLKHTYVVLATRHNHQEIVLPQMVFTEIANDSDWHRSRTGEMKYQAVGLFTLDEKLWAISRGEKCGGYPADPYDSDLLALDFSIKGKTQEQIQEELRDRIGRSDYFVNSLVYGMADGNLAVTKSGRFGQKMLEQLAPRVKDFVATPAKYNDEYLDLSTLRPICEHSVKYKPEFADFLADSIEAVLRRS